MGNIMEPTEKAPTEKRRVMTHQGLVEKEVPIIQAKPSTSSASPPTTEDGKPYGENVWGRATPFTKVVNPELHMKPNKPFGLFGLALFSACAAGLVWVKINEEPQIQNREEEPRHDEFGDQGRKR
eukprot:c16174_g1_i1.p1 GENE.c16174_g1_i1~~c16174_g1_i1.p1  ORF type:complete len:125 (+),score=21.27 c16174_g1_i1:39-413(+)